MLEISNLTKKLNGFTLNVEKLSFEDGVIFGIIGNNSSGKTTLLKSILNPTNLDSGNVSIKSINMKSNKIQGLQEVAYVSNKCGFYPNLTINQTKKFVSSYYNKWDEALFHEYIKSFGLEDSLNKKIGFLSDIGVLKVSLAMSFAHHPSLLVLDEPTVNLSSYTKMQVLVILKCYVNDSNCSILISSNSLKEIEEICDRYAFISNGKIIDCGSVINNKAEKLRAAITEEYEEAYSV